MPASSHSAGQTLETPADPSRSGNEDESGDSAHRYAEDHPPEMLRWNFWSLTIYQMVLRLGWIFKTESIIMPAVLDSLGCGPTMRAWLPLFNRLGQSVPPFLAAHRVRAAAYKKAVLTLCVLAMSVSFLALAAFWWATGGQGAWLPYLFLGVYAVFFVSTGMHQLVFGTLQGKLVPVRRRGRLMLAASLIGATVACTTAALLLPLWLTKSGGRFELVFAFTGVCFLIASLITLILREYPDGYSGGEMTWARVRSGLRDMRRQGGNVRRLALVGALFGVSVVLFPHYQALARERLGLTYENMVLWVVLQNAGTAMFSMFIGPLADRRGNRLVLIFIFAVVCLSPMLAIGLSYAGSWGARLYPLIFIFIGMTPNAIRTFNNYTLEIAKPEDHPRFLSALNLCIGAPALLSPLVGQAVLHLGMDFVFAGATVFLVMGLLLTFGLSEPRR